MCEVEYQHLSIEGDRLRPKSPAGISSARLCELGDYHISFVKREPGTAYQDHIHHDTEWMYLLSGDVTEGESEFGPGTLLTYFPDSRHDRLRTATGAEFILVRTGRQRATYL